MKLFARAIRVRHEYQFGWWVVVGGSWLVVRGGWWLVAGGSWRLVAGGWWFVANAEPYRRTPKNRGGSWELVVGRRALKRSARPSGSRASRAGATAPECPTRRRSRLQLRAGSGAATA